MTKAEREIKLKLRVLEHAKITRNTAKTCRRIGVARQIFYDWNKRYEKFGEEGLVNIKPIPKSLPSCISPEIDEKTIYLRTKYHLFDLTFFILIFYQFVSIENISAVTFQNVYIFSKLSSENLASSESKDILLEEHPEVFAVLEKFIDGVHFSQSDYRSIE